MKTRRLDELRKAMERPDGVQPVPLEDWIKFETKDLLDGPIHATKSFAFGPRYRYNLNTGERIGVRKPLLTYWAAQLTTGIALGFAASYPAAMINKLCERLAPRPVWKFDHRV